LRNSLLGPATALAMLFLTQAAAAQGLPRLDLSADLRLRLEEDWNGRTASGAARADRGRMRVRARINAALDLGSGFRLFGRVRTGDDNSQQGANTTFADFDRNPVDRLNITADRFSLTWQKEHGGVEAGRMAFPFFTQNEYFFDGDIDPLGVAANVTLPLAGGTRIKLNAGAFRLPVGLAHYAGRLYAGQMVAVRGRATVAAGFFRFAADSSDPDRLILLDGNGSRDYGVVAVNAQYRARLAGKSMVLGADLYRNVEGYRYSLDPISRANDRQRTGYVLSGIWGDTSAAGHLQLGYRYFHMEKLAVDSSYSHDDVGRFGTAAQADLTDLAGSDLFANYALTRNLSIGGRLVRATRLTTSEGGRRARLDLSYNF